MVFFCHFLVIFITFIKNTNIKVMILRFQRAISAVMIFPQDPIKAIACSEAISLIGPILNINKIFTLTLTIMYFPQFSSTILEIYNKDNKLYLDSEICLILLFNLFYFCNIFGIQ